MVNFVKRILAKFAEAQTVAGTVGDGGLLGYLVQATWLSGWVRLVLRGKQRRGARVLGT